MIYIYFSIGAAILFSSFYFIIKKVIKLRITWNEHKSHVLDLENKASHLLSINEEITRKQNKMMTQIKNLDKKIEKKCYNIENKLNAIQHELFIDYIGKLAKETKNKKQISSKTWEEIKKLLHDYKMDNRIKELLKKK